MSALGADIALRSHLNTYYCDIIIDDNKTPARRYSSQAIAIRLDTNTKHFFTTILDKKKLDKMKMFGKVESNVN